MNSANDTQHQDTQTKQILQISIGLGALAVVAAIGYAVSTGFGIATPVIVTLLLAIIVGNVVRLPRHVDLASAFAVKRVLKIAIMCLGAGVSATALTTISTSAIIAIIAGITVALAVAAVVGRRFKIHRDSATLIGVGTAICGASAIAAVVPLLRPRRDHIATALGCIFAFNAIALLVYPAIGAWLNMDASAFGTWAGVAVHDMASAVGAGFVYGQESGQIATVVKLARTLFIIPLLVVLTVALRPKATENDTSGKPGESRSAGHQIISAFPLFILGFVAMAALATSGILGGAGEYIESIGRYLLLVVFAAVGLDLKLTKLGSTGPKAAATGACASVAVGAATLPIILFV